MPVFVNSHIGMRFLKSVVLILLAIYLPGVREFLRFHPPVLSDWGYVLGAAGVYLVAFEILKIFKRARA